MSARFYTPKSHSYHTLKEQRHQTAKGITQSTKLPESHSCGQLVHDCHFHSYKRSFSFASPNTIVCSHSHTAISAEYAELTARIRPWKMDWFHGPTAGRRGAQRQGPPTRVPKPQKLPSQTMPTWTVGSGLAWHTPTPRQTLSHTCGEPHRPTLPCHLDRGTAEQRQRHACRRRTKQHMP